VVGRERQVSYEPGVVWVGPHYRRFWGGYWGYGWGTVYEPGYLREDKVVSVETLVYSFEQDELVWAGGRLGRAAMQVYYWWFSARERWSARQAREREDELRRAKERAALRAGEQLPRIEAKLGAVVPSEQLPQEPSLAQLPVDPLIAGEEVHTLQPVEENTPDRLDGREPARGSHAGAQQARKMQESLAGLRGIAIARDEKP